MLTHRYEPRQPSSKIAAFGAFCVCPLLACGGSRLVVADAGPLDVDARAPIAAWSPVLHSCRWSGGFAQSPPPPAGPAVDACPKLAGYAVTSPRVTGQDGGPVLAGTTATVTLVLAYEGAADAAPPGCSVCCPCLAISADNPGVSFSGGGPLLYCLVAGTSFSIDVRFDARLTPGTCVHFAAWAAASGLASSDGSVADCLTPPTLWDVTLN
jgi:hypothetical protein